MRPVNLKRLRMEVVEHRYQGKDYPIEKAVLLQLIDELDDARARISLLESYMPDDEATP